MTTKKHFCKLIIALVLLLALNSCERNSIAFNRVGVLKNSSKLYQINNWRIYGVFEEKPEDTAYASLLLKPYLNESSLNKETSIKKLESTIVKECGQINMLSHSIKKDVVNFKELFRIDEKLLKKKLFCAYGSCTIESEIDQEVILLTGSTGGIKCWVNGSIVLEKDVKQRFYKYQNYTKIKLQKGSNIILVKLDHKRYWNWRFYALIGNPQIAQKKHFETNSSYILEKIINNSGDSLNIVLPATYEKVEVIINSKYPDKKVYEEQIDMEGQYKIALNKDWNGYYMCIVKTKNYTYKQVFFIGDYMHELKNMKNYINDSVNTNILKDLNINPLITRIDHLLNYKPHSDRQYYPNYFKIKKHNFQILIKTKSEWLELQNSNSQKYNNNAEFLVSKKHIRKVKIVFMGNSYDTNNGLDQLIFTNSGEETIYPSAISFDKHIITKAISYDTLSKSINIPKGSRISVTFKFSNNDVKNISLKFNEDFESFVDVLYWHKKFIFVMDELKSILYDLSENNSENDTVYNSGIHFKEFISNIDGQPQQYILIIPEHCTKEKKLPLVILPPVYGFVSPFLQSIEAAAQLNNEYLYYLATKYQMAIIRMGGRNNGSHNIYPIAMADDFQSIEDSKKYIKIDKNMLFLKGGCFDAQLCLQLATRFPSKFAAMSLIHPSIWYSNGYASKQWINANQPLNHLENLYNMPINLIHSRDDEHVNFQNSMILINVAKKKNINIKSNILNGITNYDTYGNYYEFEAHFIFFKSITDRGKLCSKPNKVVFSTSQIKYNKSYWVEIKEIILHEKASVIAEFNAEKQELWFSSSNVLKLAFNFSKIEDYKNGLVSVYENNILVYRGKPNNRIKEFNTTLRNSKNSISLINKSIKEGPVVDCFSESFIVVKGTKGDIKEDNINSIVANQFNKYWYKDYFVECKIVDDIDIEDKWFNKNVVLIGTPENNQILKSIYNKLPVRVSNNSVKIQEHNFSGNINFVLLYPNPFNPKKYILWIGTNNMDSYALKETSLSKKGWYDYAVWRDSNILSAGYFNYYWE